MDISFSEIFAIPHPTYRFTPTGGVTIPIAMFTIMIQPRWIGLIPSAVATGTRIGTRI